MDQWLVRTANNILAGPYSRDQVVRLIQEGKLGLQDEVCQANHYWIFLHEHVEVERQLGIHVPRSAQGDDEEITETQTDPVEGEVGVRHVVEVNVAPLAEAPADYDGGTAVFSHGTLKEAQSNLGAPPASSNVAPPGPSSASGSTMSHLAGGGQGSTAHAQSALRTGSAYPSNHAGAPASAMNTGGRTHAMGAGTVATSVNSISDVQIERSSIWKSFAWLMIILACLIVFAVLRLLHSPHLPHI